MCIRDSSAKSLWRNRLARSAVNRKVGGSSPPGDDFFFVFLFTFLLFFKFQCKTFTFNVYVPKCVNRITVDFWETKSISTLKTLKTVLKKACFSKVLSYLMMAIFLLRKKKKLVGGESIFILLVRFL